MATARRTDAPWGRRARRTTGAVGPDRTRTVAGGEGGSARPAPALPPSRVKAQCGLPLRTLMSCGNKVRSHSLHLDSALLHVHDLRGCIRPGACGRSPVELSPAGHESASWHTLSSSKVTDIRSSVCDARIRQMPSRPGPALPRSQHCPMPEGVCDGIRLLNSRTHDGSRVSSP